LGSRGTKKKKRVNGGMKKSQKLEKGQKYAKRKSTGEGSGVQKCDFGFSYGQLGKTEEGE